MAASSDAVRLGTKSAGIPITPPSPHHRTSFALMPDTAEDIAAMLRRLGTSLSLALPSISTPGREVSLSSFARNAEGNIHFRESNVVAVASSSGVLPIKLSVFPKQGGLDQSGSPHSYTDPIASKSAAHNPSSTSPEDESSNMEPSAVRDRVAKNVTHGHCDVFDMDEETSQDPAAVVAQRTPMPPSPHKQKLEPLTRSPLTPSLLFALQRTVSCPDPLRTNAATPKLSLTRNVQEPPRPLSAHPILPAAATNADRSDTVQEDSAPCSGEGSRKEMDPPVLGLHTVGNDRLVAGTEKALPVALPEGARKILVVAAQHRSGLSGVSFTSPVPGRRNMLSPEERQPGSKAVSTEPSSDAASSTEGDESDTFE